MHCVCVLPLCIHICMNMISMYVLGICMAAIPVYMYTYMGINAILIVCMCI